jgi:tetratricopeptide (TPR) repeat protein
VAAVYSELRLAVARDDVAQAQRLYGRLTALAPNHVGARLWWSRVARRALPSTTVEQLLEPALRGSTGSPSERVQVLTRLAEARRLGGDLAEAAAHLDEALRLLPRDPGANLARAKLYLRQGKLERAAPLLAALTREPELEPELSFAALLTQVELAVQADRPLEAQEHIARLSPAQRRHPLAQYWAARVNEGAGDPVEGPKAAMRVYQRLMHDAPAQPEPYVRYAEMALERGDRRAARTALEQARRRFLQAPPSDAVDTAALASLQELTAAVLGAAPPRSR